MVTTFMFALSYSMYAEHDISPKEGGRLILSVDKYLFAIRGLIIILLNSMGLCPYL